MLQPVIKEYSDYFFKLILLLLAMQSVILSFASAQTEQKNHHQNSNSLLASSLIIDQKIQTSFTLSKAYFVVSNLQFKQTIRHPAEIKLLENDSEKKIYRVAAFINKDIFGSHPTENSNQILFSVLLFGDNDQVAATPAKPTSIEELQNNTKTIFQMQVEAKAKKSQLPLLETKNQILHKELLKIKDQATQMLEVDEIINLKSILAGFNSNNSSPEKDLAYINQLIDETYQKNKNNPAAENHTAGETELIKLKLASAWKELAENSAKKN